jgi:myo-inositol-1(or 4)-monophosphatase
MDRLIVAKQAAMEAGAFLRKRFQGPLQVDEKRSYDDVVSDADHGSEDIILRRVREIFPKDGILSEESGQVQEGEFTWVIDPLDGSINYVNGLPYCAVSIAVAHAQTLVAGVVYQPFTDELFWAQQGSGAWFANTRLRAQDRSFKEGVVCADFGRTNKEEIVHWIERLSTHCRYVRSLGSCALALCELARGWTQGYVQNTLYPWDAAAGVLIARESGAVVTNLEGKPWKLSDPYLIAGSSKQVHKQITNAILR